MLIYENGFEIQDGRICFLIGEDLGEEEYWYIYIYKF